MTRLIVATIRAERVTKRFRGTARVEETELRQRLEQLRIAHRDLDAAIDAIVASNAPDQLRIARLKRQKLRLRDDIALIEDQIIPDIIA